MIKLDLVNQIVERTGVSKTKAEHAVDTIFNCMKDALKANDRIELRGEAVGGETRGAKFFYDEANPQASGICYARGKTIDVQVRRLRAKLGQEGRRITTVKSIGYRLEEPG